MMATPAVACGTKTCSRPSPRPATNRLASSVMSRTTGREPVRTVMTSVCIGTVKQVAGRPQSLELELEEPESELDEPESELDEPESELDPDDPESELQPDPESEEDQPE